MTTIVVPLDGSRESEAALPWATMLARSQSASLLLTRVVVGRRYRVDLDVGVQEEHVTAGWREAAAYLAEVKQQLEGEDVSVAIDVQEGLATPRILKVAREADASAIVLSTHARGGFGRLMLGSIADEVLRDSPVPVLLVPPGAAGLPRVGRILVPLDGSRLAEQALPLAQTLASSGGQITLLRVVPLAEGFVEAGGFTEIGFDEATTQRNEHDAVAYLSEIATGLGAPSEVGKMVVRGVAAERIDAAARELPADIVVMSTHGYAGLHRFRVGSVANELIRQSSAPIFLITGRMAWQSTVESPNLKTLANQHLLTLTIDEPIISAARRMIALRVTAVPVVDGDGALVGVISVRDLLARARRGSGEFPWDPGETVARILPGTAITVDESAARTKAADTLLQHGLDAITVVRDNKPVGVLTPYELLAALLGES
jgi:nucleotide-binding universal stress UspA family protein/predicted transcriptional regulator